MNSLKKERDAVYKTIFSPVRDVRREFKPDPIPNDCLLERVLLASYHGAPSVVLFAALRSLHYCAKGP